jgi:hypothetical protein
MTRAMSVMGAGVIFLGAFLGLVGLAPVGVASVVGGAIIEAVGFLFHKQTNLSRERVIRIENDLMRLKLAKQSGCVEGQTIASIYC